MPVPSGISIRAVRPADASRWLEMREALWPDERPRHARDIAGFFAGTLEEPVAILVAETAAAALVGMVELSLRADIPGLLGQRTGYVEGLYVVPQFRFCGVAYRLLAGARAWAREHRCSAFATDREDRLIIDRGFAPQSS